jgi:transcriptional regulator with XRE-family HTH domain
MDAGNTTDDDSREQGEQQGVNAGGPLIKELRQGRGWSQRDEAQLLKHLARRFGFHHIAGTKTRSVVREIQRWEAGEHAPDERYQLLLAHAYATRDGSATIEPGSDLGRVSKVGVSREMLPAWDEET